MIDTTKFRKRGKPIGAERLAAISWTRLCIDDQRRASS